jgi:phosphoglycerol transferase MdoB-like AlkP superfamily enzyme
MTIVLGLSAEAYGLYKLFINLDNCVEVYISFNPNFAQNSIDIPVQSIQEILLNLQTANYISFIVIITLMLLTMLKFHYNKKIKNLFVWLVLLTLMVTLAFMAYTFEDLYTNIDTYVNIYIKFKK